MPSDEEVVVSSDGEDVDAEGKGKKSAAVDFVLTHSVLEIARKKETELLKLVGMTAVDVDALLKEKKAMRFSDFLGVKPGDISGRLPKSVHGIRARQNLRRWTRLSIALRPKHALLFLTTCRKL